MCILLHVAWKFLFGLQHDIILSSNTWQFLGLFVMSPWQTLEKLSPTHGNFGFVSLLSYMAASL